MPIKPCNTLLQESTLFHFEIVNAIPYLFTTCSSGNGGLITNEKGKIKEKKVSNAIKKKKQIKKKK